MYNLAILVFFICQEEYDELLKYAVVMPGQSQQNIDQSQFNSGGGAQSSSNAFAFIGSLSMTPLLESQTENPVTEQQQRHYNDASQQGHFTIHYIVIVLIKCHIFIFMSTL